MSAIRDVLAVARYELGEAARTRLALLATLGYAVGIGATNWIFVQVLKQMENAAATAMGVPATDRPGTMAQHLLEKGQLRDLMEPLVDAGDGIETLLQEPLIAAWSGATAMAILPAVALALASGSISAEVRSHSIRYLAVRTSRLSIGGGKFLGQILLLVAVALVGAAVVEAMGLLLMVGNPPLALLQASTKRALLAAVYAIPWAGLGLAISCAISNPMGARIASAIAFVAVHALAGLAATVEGDGIVARAIDLATLLLPSAAWGELWSSDGVTLAGAMARCVVLGLGFLGLGQAILERRDL
jgi:hypothetical protein